MQFLQPSTIALLSGLFFLTCIPSNRAQPYQLEWFPNSMDKLEKELSIRYNSDQLVKLKKGMHQAATFWHEADGNAEVFESFVRDHFAGDQVSLDALFNRFESNLEQLDGHMNEIAVSLRRQVDLDVGAICSFDELFSGYDPSAHIQDDFFNNKLAFAVLLNFPQTTLEQRLIEGETWSRRQWAETRLAQRFSKRIPSEVNLAIAEATAIADQYISEYNIWMHHLLNDRGERFFSAGMKLLTHWNLRDEIKAQYSNKAAGLIRQQMIQKVMERIIFQTIPETVINNPHVDWNPFTNEFKLATVQDAGIPLPADLDITGKREPDSRYATWFSTFLAARKMDPYSPSAPTLIARRFDENREIPEIRVKAMFEQVLTSPLLPKVAELIKTRLGRPLQPFDIWYNGFRSRGTYTEIQLDSIVSKKYPTAQAFEKDIPTILIKLGFPKEHAEAIAVSIVVEPARGSGHAAGASMRSAKCRLRTRVGKNGMDYKGYNIAIHELGHNVEQVLSLQTVDHTLLSGVPNTAFTEALAYVFQTRDLELLGLSQMNPESKTLNILNEFWATSEISSVALVDMAAWHWMYDHPNATPADLKMAVLQIAKDIWNRYYAPAFKQKDVVLFAIYSHLVDGFLYLPDYAIGHLISHQIEGQMNKTGHIGMEFERMVKAGSIAPDLWMKNATGFPVGAEALLSAAERAYSEIRASRK